MGKLLELNKENFNQEVLESQKPVAVDFWATWCTPCRMMEGPLEELSEELADQLKIVKMNIEDPDSQELAEQYQVQSVPHIKLFKNGQVIGDFAGLKNKETLEEELKKALDQ